MGNFLAFLEEAFNVYLKSRIALLSKNTPYALYDPMQSLKPPDSSKDIISHKHRNDSTQLDTVCFKGCDTVWKCFKRTVW